MSWVSKLKHLSQLEGYKKPKVYKDKIKLDTNENIAIPRSLIAKVMRKVSMVDVREYPSNYDDLRRDLARYLNVKKDCIAIGNGSDQIMDMIISNIAGGKAVTIKPTFSFYIARCKLHDLEIKEVSLDNNLSFDSREIINSNADLFYLCSPNNPTGNQFDREFVIDIINSFKGLVVIDEAYAEFARYSLKDLVSKYDNLIILRTMSKAFGLAGLRIGYAIANASLIDTFNNIIQYPYPVNSIAVNASRMMLGMKDEIIKIVEDIKRERERVYEAINSIGLHAFRSDANFIMFEGDSKIFNGLLREGIVIKDLGKINSKRCYRVTIGSKSINDRFISALKKVSS